MIYSEIHKEQKLEMLLDLLHSLLPYIRKHEIKRRIARSGIYYSRYQPTDKDIECLQKTSGYFWLNQKFRSGRSRADIILDFNRNRRTDPENYCTPDNRPMTLSLFEICIRSYEEMYLNIGEDLEDSEEYPEQLDYDFQPDSNFEFKD